MFEASLVLLTNGNNWRVSKQTTNIDRGKNCSLIIQLNIHYFFDRYRNSSSSPTIGQVNVVPSTNVGEALSSLPFNKEDIFTQEYHRQ